MSFIHYKFKSAKEVNTITFEGLGLPLWELKREIAQAKKLTSANDFDLVVINAQNNEEYVDDYQMVHKNSSVIVKRVPMAPSKKSSLNRIISVSTPLAKTAPTIFAGSGDSEEQKIQAMMSQSQEKWSRSSQTDRPFKRFNVPQRPPPPNYTCFKCGKKDHYIQNCPLNSASDAPRVKKTTGIPKTFLKPVSASDNKKILSSISDGALMMAPDGGLVVARPNA